jgi:hypothetical protein
LEQTIGAVAQTLGSNGSISRCENMAQLAVEIGRMVEAWTSLDRNRRLVLVFDGIDRQKDAPPTMMPALARLGDIVSCQSYSGFDRILTCGNQPDPKSDHDIHSHISQAKLSPLPRCPSH